MIQAYPDQLSVEAGDTLVLHVGTDRAEFRVALFRQGAALTLQRDFGWQRANRLDVDPGGTDADWGWDGYDFATGRDWPSGVYVAMLSARDGEGGLEDGPDGGTSTTAGAYGKALFVLRSATPGRNRILYRVPVATYHAYNLTGGASLYRDSPGRVTMLRPGGGTGGVVTDAEEPGVGNSDPLDPASHRQTFEHLDAKFIRWLEGEGFSVDYCADIDVHRDSEGDLLRGYNLVLSVGHDEYWSAGTLANLASYVTQGGNLGFFSGNTCWWRITYDSDLSGFSCNRDGNPANPSSDQWWVLARHGRTPLHENALTGASYRNGGGWWFPGRPRVGYTVQDPDHWVFEPGAVQGDEFGGPQGLVGYECDGAELTAESGDSGNMAVPTHRDGTPESLRVLAVALLGDGWAFEPRDPDSPTAAVAPRAATMGVYTASGTVFNAATADWARVLSEGEETVARVTRNVLRRLGGVAPARLSLGRIPGITALDGVYSPDGSRRHVVVATGDGDVIDLALSRSTETAATVKATFAGLIDVGGFVSDDDRCLHFLAAQRDGSVTDVVCAPDGGFSQIALGRFAGVLAVSGFYSPDDGHRHAVVAQEDGTVSEVRYDREATRSLTALGNFPGLADVGSFYSTDDQYRHVIVLADGDVTEVYYHPQLPSGQDVVASFTDATRVSAYYAGHDAHFTRRVLVACPDGRVHDIRFGRRADVVRSVIGEADHIVDLGGFSAGDDQTARAVLAFADGTVEDLSS